jgi:hypothetical protein
MTDEHKIWKLATCAFLEKSAYTLSFLDKFQAKELTDASKKLHEIFNVQCPEIVNANKTEYDTLQANLDDFITKEVMKTKIFILKTIGISEPKSLLFE